MATVTALISSSFDGGLELFMDYDDVTLVPSLYHWQSTLPHDVHVTVTGAPNHTVNYTVKAGASGSVAPPKWTVTGLSLDG